MARWALFHAGQVIFFFPPGFWGGGGFFFFSSAAVGPAQEGVSVDVPILEAILPREEAPGLAAPGDSYEPEAACRRGGRYRCPQETRRASGHLVSSSMYPFRGPPSPASPREKGVSPGPPGAPRPAGTPTARGGGRAGFSSSAMVLAPGSRVTPHSSGFFAPGSEDPCTSPAPAALGVRRPGREAVGLPVFIGDPPSRVLADGVGWGASGGVTCTGGTSPTGCSVPRSVVGREVPGGACSQAPGPADGSTLRG